MNRLAATILVTPSHPISKSIIYLTRSGHALAQTISHLPLTVEAQAQIQIEAQAQIQIEAQAQIQSHASPCGICG